MAGGGQGRCQSSGCSSGCVHPTLTSPVRTPCACAQAQLRSPAGPGRAEEGLASTCRSQNMHAKVFEQHEEGRGTGWAVHGLAVACAAACTPHAPNPYTATSHLLVPWASEATPAPSSAPCPADPAKHQRGQGQAGLFVCWARRGPLCAAACGVCHALCCNLTPLHPSTLLTAAHKLHATCWRLRTQSRGRAAGCSQVHMHGSSCHAHAWALPMACAFLNC